ncbi:hypothetical protein [Tumebacillus flagellatus]|nr:hypothetical protein [Tumebacillus flagellatus]
MTVWLWILKFVVFFVVFRIAHVLMWNFRKAFYVHPLVTDLVVTFLALVVLGSLTADSWYALCALAILLGVIRGDQEHGEAVSGRRLM